MTCSAVRRLALALSFNPVCLTLYQTCAQCNILSFAEVVETLVYLILDVLLLELTVYSACAIVTRKVVKWQIHRSTSVYAVRPPVCTWLQINMGCRMQCQGHKWPCPPTSLPHSCLSLSLTVSAHFLLRN